jgi:hypothetical protein
LFALGAEQEETEETEVLNVLLDGEGGVGHLGSTEFWSNVCQVGVRTQGPERRKGRKQAEPEMANGKVLLWRVGEAVERVLTM